MIQQTDSRKNLEDLKGPALFKGSKGLITDERKV